MHSNYNRSRLKLIGKLSLVVIGIILATSMLPHQSVFAILGINFDAEKNLSDSSGLSQSSQLAALGNDVHVVWHDGVKIFLSSSTDKGSNFDTPQDLGNAIFSTGANPQVSLSDANVYAAWNDGTDDTIQFSRSDNRGQSFSSVKLSDSSSTSNLDVQLSSSDDNVYVIWRDNEGFEDDRILVRASTDNADNFNSIFELEDDTDSRDPIPQIASFGSNVYAIWSSSTAISFAKNDNSGNNANWNSLLLLDSDGTPSNPQIATVDNKVYVVWQDDFDINFATSTDSGDNFVIEVIGASGHPLSDQAKPQLAIKSDGSVFVVWRDQTFGTGDIDGDIKFRARDSSGTWDPPLNVPPEDLSANSGVSENPKVAVAGNNVYVVWSDKTDDSTGEILMRSSSDNGANFGGKQKVGSGTTSRNPDVAAVTGDHVYVSWSAVKDSIRDIFFAAGTPSIDVSFDKNQFKLSDTAVITVTDPDSTGDVTITLDSVTSSSDATGILDFELTETPANSGTFVGSLTFGDTTSGTTLEAKAGDTITATFDGQATNASIQM